MIKPLIFALLLSPAIAAPLVPVQAEPVGPGQKSAIGKPDDVQDVSHGYDGFKVDDLVARRMVQPTQPTQASQPTEPSHHKQQNQDKGTR